MPRRADASLLTGPARDDTINERSVNRTDVADLLVPIHIKKGDLELRLFCTFMTFGTPQDVTLQELRIETFFPADDVSARVWGQLVADGPITSGPGTGARHVEMPQLLG